MPRTTHHARANEPRCAVAVGGVGCVLPRAFTPGSRLSLICRPRLALGATLEHELELLSLSHAHPVKLRGAIGCSCSGARRCEALSCPLPRGTTPSRAVTGGVTGGFGALQAESLAESLAEREREQAQPSRGAVVLCLVEHVAEPDVRHLRSCSSRVVEL